MSRLLLLGMLVISILLTCFACSQQNINDSAGEQIVRAASIPLRDHEDRDIEYKGPYFGQEPPGLEPELLAPGLVSIEGFWDYAGVFSPDGTEFYFTRSKTGEDDTILVTLLQDGKWTEPLKVEFAGEHYTHEPCFAPDGTRLFFGSARPLPDGRTFSSFQKGYKMWVVEREGAGWGEPYLLGSEVEGSFLMYVSAADSGNLYVGTAGDIVVIRPIGSGYSAPERIGPPFADERGRTGHPCIAPDESFMLLDSDRAGTLGELDIFVSFRLHNGAWSEPVGLGPAVNTPGSDNCPRLTPDGKFFLYSSERSDRGKSDIYWISTEIIHKTRQKLTADKQPA